MGWKLFWGFWGRYFIGTALLVGLYKIWSSNMAAQYNAPLRFGKHTMMGEILNNKRFIRWWYLNVKINYCNWIIVVWDYFVCSVALHCDAWDSNSKIILSYCFCMRFFWGRYFMNKSLVVCCYNNESQIWRY